jgi:hypothetical protein
LAGCNRLFVGLGAATHRQELIHVARPFSGRFTARIVAEHFQRIIPDGVIAKTPTPRSWHRR